MDSLDCQPKKVETRINCTGLKELVGDGYEFRKEYCWCFDAQFSGSQKPLSLFLWGYL